jgi:DNA ligase-1
MKNDFDDLQLFVDEMKATSSSNLKKDILDKWKDVKFILKILLYVNNPYWTYGVTSNQVKKMANVVGKHKEHSSVFDLLDDLRDRKLTGHKAILSIKAFSWSNMNHEDLILNIIDKDIKTRANASLINKVIPGLIPEFKVALANPYQEKLVDFGKEEWYTSRKLDGVRCICRIENGTISFFSRTGKSFETLGILERAIRKAGADKIDMVLDGEICKVDKDGKEDFQSVMREIRKKTKVPDHIPGEQDEKYKDKKGRYEMKNPKFFMFDCLTLEEFDNKESEIKLEDRLERIPEYIPHFEKLHQNYTLITPKYIELCQEEASINGWEGIMLRKDTGYKGKRSNDLLKVKTFMDAEYRVISTINDKMRWLENGKEVEVTNMAAAVISHKGFDVKVGSGFNRAERELYYNDPSQIIGKLITVQYFEETTNLQDDSLSLRFPTFKCIHGKERVV